MDFTINCQCGATLRDATADAGGIKRCRCGHENSVPSLSKLRQESGQQAYDVSTAEKLRYMFADGDLPPNNVCVQCGCETSDVLQCSVECERPHTKGRGFWGTFFLGLFAPLSVFHSIHQEYQNPEVFGRELIVDTPVPMCSKCQIDLRPRKKTVRELLCRVPLYGQLFQEYPDADAHVLSEVPTE